MLLTFDDKEKKIDAPEDPRAASSKKIKKAILAFLAVFAAILILYFALLGIYNVLTAPSDEGQGGSEKIYFYPVIPDEDIYSNEEYMALMRDLCYYNTDTGVTHSVLPEKYEDFGEGFVLMARMVESIIAGDCEAYNSCFSPKYYETCLPKADFTPQKLYGTVGMGGILITKVNPSTVVGLESDNDKAVFYKVEYMIFRNNGTFRNDVGSDTNKPVLYEVSEQTDGSFLIDRVMNIVQK